MPGKVMLVDDHALFMEGLQYLLKTHGVNVVGAVKNGRDALAQARQLKPDIILMDIRMPECSGLDVLKLIKAEMPDIRIVMLTTSDENEDLFDAIKYGASGYLLKNTSAKELVNMLFDLKKGGVPLSPGLAVRLLKEFSRSAPSADNFSQQTIGDTQKRRLTERQLKVLEMVAGGMTYKETGGALGLTERTIKYHMGRIIELLQLENRAQVIAYAAQMGLIEGK
ncbi:MAG: Response regulator protein VraR [Pelotomaculum sp. PtaU1.Bin065]|nr:MAG: Response regulator protein VraR [Pelotomaculum sp. PtaU1.Bin065]